MNPKIILLSLIGLVVTVVLGIGSYFLFTTVEEVHQQNVEDLAGFGSKVVPLSSREGEFGATFGLADGNIQMPPSLQKKKLSPTEKVILALSHDKDELLVQVTELQQQLDLQTEALNDLRQYKAENERFAPEQLVQERARAQQMIKEYFENASEVTEFSPFVQQVMMLASANVYAEVVRQHQLMLRDKLKDEMVKLLPEFGLCLGDSLPFVVNNRAEEIRLLQALADNKTDSLSGELGKDFKVIHEPCLKRLNRQVIALLEKHGDAVLTPADVAFVEDTEVTSEAAPSLPPFDPTLSPTEQLIRSLEFDKEQLLVQVEKMQVKLATQAQEITDLGVYRDQTERYAPLPAQEERQRAHQLLIEYFDESEDTFRFNSFEKQAMSLSAANQYAAFSKRHRLVLTERVKDEIIQIHLPNYGFCIGDGLKFVIDNRLQERQLINALREQDEEFMTPDLATQIKTITEPCAASLERQLQAFL